MYLFLENEHIIKICDILFIIDYIHLENPINKESFEEEFKRKKVINLSKGNEKSVIVTDENIYFSSYNTQSIKKRMKEFFNIVGGI